MSETIPRPRVLARLSAGVLAAAVLTIGGLLVAAPASAHDELLGSDPAADATVETLPEELTLTFSAVISGTEGASEVQVTDSAGTELAGAPYTQENLLKVPVEAGAAGAVTVLWKVVSSDGHPISGQYAFTVTAPPAPTPTGTPSATPTETAEPSASASASAPAETETPAPIAAPMPEESGSSSLPWIIGGIVLLLAVIGAVTYLLVSRSRRQRSLTAGSETDPTDPDPSTDR